MFDYMSKLLFGYLSKEDLSRIYSPFIYFSIIAIAVNSYAVKVPLPVYFRIPSGFIACIFLFLASQVGAALIFQMNPPMDRGTVRFILLTKLGLIVVVISIFGIPFA